MRLPARGHEDPVHLQVHRAAIRGLLVGHAPLDGLRHDVLRDVDVEVKVDDVDGLCLRVPVRVPAVVCPAHRAGAVLVVLSADVQQQLGRNTRLGEQEPVQSLSCSTDFLGQ